MKRVVVFVHFVTWASASCIAIPVMWAFNNRPHWLAKFMLWWAPEIPEEWTARPSADARREHE